MLRSLLNTEVLSEFNESTDISDTNGTSQHRLLLYNAGLGFGFLMKVL